MGKRENGTGRAYYFMIDFCLSSLDQSNQSNATEQGKNRSVRWPLLRPPLSVPRHDKLMPVWTACSSRDETGAGTLDAAGPEKFFLKPFGAR